MFRVVLLLIVLRTGFAQSVWIGKPNIPAYHRCAAFGFVIGTKGYFGGGATGPALSSDLWEWDQGTNAWVQKANYPGNGRSGCVAFSIGNKGYVTTGFDGNNHGYGTHELWEWDQSTNSWSKKADFPGGDQMYACGFSIGTKGYVLANAPNGFWEWDQLTNVWTQKASLPAGATQEAVAFSIGINGYVVTGSNATNPYCSQDLWEWNQMNNSWTKKANFPSFGRCGATGFAIGNKGYVGIGYARFGNLPTDFWQWDQTNNSWGQIASFPGSARGMSTSFAIGTNGYIAAGTDFYNYYNEFWEYNSLITDVNILPEADSKGVIFPNPSQGVFQVENMAGKWRVINSLGEIVLEGVLTALDNFRIDLTNYPSGVYIFEIEDALIESRVKLCKK